ncbi:hypothetical protein [Chitinophaga sp. Cy-1792]|uniref:hypothetical protein n=1 Tax=Chitinophaga sp. Cy-1792 TaxID=2608339 RepID=UPI0014245B79|nr:hypothetical protein [Chitinophaga sp. Cy-1792]NIG53540.1 hypothetical protein [Chitinophaga sp. Cy-1792]
MKKCLVLILLFVSNCVLGQAGHIKEPDYEGYIFPASFKKVEKWVFEEARGRFTPTPAEIAIVERIVKLQLEEEEKTSSYKLHICAHLKMYKRQYVGFFDKSGHKVIWVNALLSNYPFPLSSQIIEVDDGGESFWQMLIDLKEKKGFGFSINSLG